MSTAAATTTDDAGGTVGNVNLDDNQNGTALSTNTARKNSDAPARTNSQTPAVVKRTVLAPASANDDPGTRTAEWGVYYIVCGVLIFLMLLGTLYITCKPLAKDPDLVAGGHQGSKHARPMTGLVDFEQWLPPNTDDVGVLDAWDSEGFAAQPTKLEKQHACPTLTKTGT